ncbi:MAG: DNA adenine methylase [Salinivirgaceae bacterium]
MKSKASIPAKPFLKWAGGKTQLLPAIEARFPFTAEQTFTYVEPFVGSGAVLFWVLNRFPNLKKAVINDVNSDLIAAYRFIASRVDELIQLLEIWQNQYHAIEDDKELKHQYYYTKRELFNLRNTDALTQTALLLFLNRTCFNGLYRVNAGNGFNVPMGRYKKPTICDAANLKAVSKVLQKVDIMNSDFEETANGIEAPAFFYFDPPYKPLNATSSFNSYATGTFGDTEQLRLKEFCDVLHRQGHHWMLSNSDVQALNPEDDFFDSLYHSYFIERVPAKRNINSNGQKRGTLTELLITNYR